MITGMWNEDSQIVESMRGLTFKLLSGEKAIIFEIIRTADKDAYHIILDMPNETYMRLNYSRDDLTKGDFKDIVRKIHSDILDSTGGSIEVIESKVFKAIHGD